MNLQLMSEHQQRVREFMEKAGQALPDTPTLPTPEVALLRARLLLEEAIETVYKGYGCIVRPKRPIVASIDDLEIIPALPPNMVEIADGHCDVSVVNVGGLLACGMVDLPLLAAVDESNLKKFGPGGYRRADGKWQKGPDFQPPDIAKCLKEQGWTG